MDNPETAPEDRGPDGAADPADVTGSAAPHGSPVDQSDEATTEPETGIETGAGATGGAAAIGAGLRWGVIAAGLCAVCAVVAAIVGLVRWVDTDSAVADPRAEIIDDASQAVLNLFTFDPADTDTYIEVLASSFTGPMAEEVEEFGEEILAQAAQDGVERRPRVHSITLTDYVDGADEASVLAMLTVDMIQDGQRLNIRRHAVDIGLQRVDGVWKVAETAPLFMGDEVLPGYGPDGEGTASEGPK